jgi:hypothetical protein
MANPTRLTAGGIVAVHHKGEGARVNAGTKASALRSQALLAWGQMNWATRSLRSTPMPKKATAMPEP